MSDQGELAGRRGTPSDDTNDLDPVDRPTGPFPQVDQTATEDERIDADGGAPVWEPAKNMSFSTDRGPRATPGGPGGPDSDDHSAGPADDRPDSWSERTGWTESTDPQYPGDAQYPGYPERPTPAVWDAADEPETGTEHQIGPSPSKPVWEGSLFEDGGMDSGPGDPRYAPVDMSGPSTPPKPGTPSSGNLRLPDWMKESGDGESDGDEGSGFGRAGAASRDHADGGGGRSRTMLYAGVGLLIVALIAVGGVFLLQVAGGSDTDSGSLNSGDDSARSAVPIPKQVAASLPPDRRLRSFPGAPTKVVGQVRDTHVGLAYPRFGSPWVLPTKQNRLAQRGWSGQQIVVTEQAGKQIWYGQLLSGPMGIGDRGSYRGSGSEREAAVAVSTGILDREYAFKRTATPFASQALDVDGHKGWLVATALHYRRAGVKATGELVVVAVVDTGRKDPAVLFLAVPNTHQKLWPDVNALIGNLHVIT